MSEVIDFLEKVGQDARLRYAGTPELAKALAESSVTPAERLALLAGDGKGLEALVGAQANVCCIVAPGKEEEEEEEEEEDDEEEDEEIGFALS